MQFHDIVSTRTWVWVQRAGEWCSLQLPAMHTAKRLPELRDIPAQLADPGLAGHRGRCRAMGKPGGSCHQAEVSSGLSMGYNRKPQAESSQLSVRGEVPDNFGSVSYYPTPPPGKIWDRGLLNPHPNCNQELLNPPPKCNLLPSGKCQWAPSKGLQMQNRKFVIFCASFQQ